jgi:FkbM family methyltransferase
MLKPTLRRILNRAGWHISRVSSNAVLADNILGRRDQLTAGAFGFLPHETDFYNYYIRHRHSVSLHESFSQLGQDLWVAFLLNAVEDRAAGVNRFFVEFGAFDGRTYSNTYFLEKELGWRGLLAEPIPIQFDACRRNRDCMVDDRCVWIKSGETLTFNVVCGANEYGTIEMFDTKDVHAERRVAASAKIEVRTISLKDLLVDRGAPPIVDYLSIDTEGSELAIMNAFDFNAFSFRVISIEHNFGVQRAAINALLMRNGYFRLARSVDYFDYIYLNRQWFSDKLGAS